MPITPKQIINLLEKNGFVEIRQNGSSLPKGTEQKILKDAGLI